MTDKQLDEEDDFTPIPGYVPASRAFSDEPSLSAKDIQAMVDAARQKYSQRRKPIEEEKNQIDFVNDSNDLDREAERRAHLRLNQFPPYFAQLPDALLTTKRVNPEAKIVYALMHKHAAINHLNQSPVVGISQETLADELGRTGVTIRSLIQQLLDAGWIRKYRQGKMKVNRYVLYARSKRMWEAHVAMERVQVMINRNQGLAKRLRESLHPITDQKNPYGHRNPAKERVTKSSLWAY
jgi:DNA-binding MarR family transcriptional regulator